MRLLARILSAGDDVTPEPNVNTDYLDSATSWNLNHLRGSGDSPSRIRNQYGLRAEGRPTGPRDERSTRNMPGARQRGAPPGRKRASGQSRHRTHRLTSASLRASGWTDSQIRPFPNRHRYVASADRISSSEGRSILSVLRSNNTAIRYGIPMPKTNEPRTPRVTWILFLPMRHLI
jgi:hypothetical protein